MREKTAGLTSIIHHKKNAPMNKMRQAHWSLWVVMTGVITVSIVSCTLSLEKPGLVTAAETQDPKISRPPHDAVTEAQEARSALTERPEQRTAEHDRSGFFKATKATPSSPAFLDQPRDGKIAGFDFYRDPLGSETPMQEPEEMMKKDIAAKPKVMETQRKLLERRYHLDPKPDPQVKMSRGKPLPVGPTARPHWSTSYARCSAAMTAQRPELALFTCNCH